MFPKSSWIIRILGIAVNWRTFRMMLPLLTSPTLAKLLLACPTTTHPLPSPNVFRTMSLPVMTTEDGQLVRAFVPLQLP
jgi:hypothetical protein